ncbi:MAG: WS/DGAT domain-containing protein, partial [Jiangellaceae bacterium]
AAQASYLGNVVSPMLVPVPATGSIEQRLRHVDAAVRAYKDAASGPPPIALLGWLFRSLTALGGYRWYMNRQRRLHTLVSHVRGPAETFSFGGYRVGSAIAAAVGLAGNVTVSFEVFSYGGTLTLTAIFDPDQLPDVDTLIDGMRAELDLIGGAAMAPR